MTDPSGVRPSLRLIAGELVNTLATEVDAAAEIAQIALTGRSLRSDPAVKSDESRDAPSTPRTRIAVVGGGIAGLAAAWSLIRDRGAEADVAVYEASEQVGGKLRLGNIGGITVDVGAESMLAVRPEALALARSVGLGSSIVHPAVSNAGLVSRGRLRELPPGLIGGVPTDLRALAASDILSLPGLLRIPFDQILPRTTIDVDVSVGDYVATRMGREVVERLVEPLLGGVYAGRSEELSLEMAVPALFRLARRERSLLSAAREARATGAAPSGARRGPVFAGISGGVGRLPVALAERLHRKGATIEVNATVTGLRRTAAGWGLLVDQAGESRRIVADVVILAVPAPAAAKLLRRVHAEASTLLGTVDYANVALATLLYEPRAVPESLQGSGFLVPPVEGLAVKAATYSSRKWAWVARAGVGGKQAKGQRRRNYMVVRASLGRYGELQALQHDDTELVELAAKELHQISGLPERPLVAEVTRWGGALPQYTVGHRGRVAKVRELLVDTPGLAVCGAAYDGVGIAACIGSAQFAAGQVAAYLSERGQWAHG